MPSLKTKRLQEICDDYAAEHGVAVLDLEDVSRWAISTGRWVEATTTPQKRCKRELAAALRRAHHVDPQNRQPRTWHAALVEDPDGQIRWEWADMRTAEPKHMHLSQQYGRRQVLDHCRQHKLVTDSYNDNNPYGAELAPTDYNFNLDLEEEAYSTEYPEEPDDDQ